MIVVMETTTATKTFDQMSTRDEWAGFGYLGERRNHVAGAREERGANAAAIAETLVAATDARILDYTSEAGWTAEEVFAWANSKAGRHFADVIFGGAGRFDQRWSDAMRWNLLAKQPTD